MKIPVVQIGNSKGIRIPQPILRQCNIDEEVELEVDRENIVLKPVYKKEYDISFDNVSELEDKDIIEMLKRTDVVTLAISLIGADDASKNKFFKNMSKRAHELFVKEIEKFSSMNAIQLIVEMHRARINRTFTDIL